MTETPKTTPKISVKIWKPLIQMLDQKLEAACLRRDAFLTKLLQVELDHLDEEVSIPNTQASYDFVFSRLDAFDRKLVSLALPSELTSKLNDICQRKRIVRDAFFNRLFLLLAVSPAEMDSLLFDGYETDWRLEVWEEYRHEQPVFDRVFYPLQPLIDPFWAVRCAMTSRDTIEDYVEPISGQTIQIKRDLVGSPIPLKSVYTTLFPKISGPYDLRGFSCYLPDWEISGAEAEKAHKAAIQAITDQLLRKFSPENLK